ncbi:hypothetical protein HY642_01745 [Candidatus Woesearchaeota archaeon]|nr:hypothetical protein [Candidatus Woesearchaeota archaeon]
MPDIFSDTLYRDLEKLNFSMNESKVYLALLRLGPSFAGRIAAEATLDRSSAYNALKQLIHRGIVSTVYEKKRAIFVAADPKKILDYYKEKEEIATTVIPRLREQFKATKEEKRVTLFQGFKGLKTVLQDILDSLSRNSELLMLGSDDLFLERMPYYAPIFKKRLQEKGAKLKLIGATAGIGRRAIPSTQSPANILIYDKKAAILLWEKPEAILIEQPRVSQALQGYFDFMWKHART